MGRVGGEDELYVDTFRSAACLRSYVSQQKKGAQFFARQTYQKQTSEIVFCFGH